MLGVIFDCRVNQQVQHYEKFLKKTSAGVEKLSFCLGLALILFLTILIFSSETEQMLVPLALLIRLITLRH